MLVVPELSERCTTVIGNDFGNLTPGFSAAMRGSFQFVISPRKIEAKVSLESLSCAAFTRGTFTIGTTAPVNIGNCTRPFASHWAAVSGASEPAKSMVPALIWLMPAPDPTDW